MLHGVAGTASWEVLEDPSTVSHGASVTLGLCFLFAAMGKSALFPVSGWLPRAMEGPTPSSAVYYGALSIHGGVFLLLRAAPLIEREPVVSAAVVALGLATTLHATIAARVHPDVKGALAYATLTQVGLMLVWIGLGWHTLALFHLVTHALLRAMQLLRSPSVIHEAHRLYSQLGRVETERALAARWLPAPVVRFLHTLGLERFYFDALLEGLVAGPIGAIGRSLDRFERRLAARILGEVVPPGPPRAPLEEHVSTTAR
jgi:NADH:ubiquinone oxidoreductase subunit 5 (subunit L)/multisubunit Na+/H+ antiporter MnhA subunit